MARIRVSKQETLPAPVGGWNARDPLANMDPKDAIALQNIYPLPSECMLRKGYASHATGMTGQVETLLPYRGLSASVLFAAVGANIYNVTSAGAVGAAVVTSLSSAQFQYAQVNIAGTSYLYCLNGADKPQLYNGSTWVAVDGVSTPAITGVTTTDLIHVTHWKQRLWFVQKATMDAWYLPASSIGGAATRFRFGDQFKEGGILNAIESFSTYDAGDGPDDYLVALSTEGELLVYKGTDPASVSTFAIVGRYKTGRPLGRKCFVKFGGDLLILTTDGFVSMSKIMQRGSVQIEEAISDKIRNAVTQVVSTFGTNYGWQGVLYPPANMLLVNIPAGLGLQQQYVMNNITGSWAQFTNMPANCWETLGNNIYFGGNGVVYQAWTGFADNGGDVVGIGQQAVNYFGARGRVKHFKLCRPLLASENIFGVNIGMDVDYGVSELYGSIAVAPGGATGTWGSSVWGAFLWGGATQTFNQWLTLPAVGTACSFRIRLATQAGTVSWAATDFLYEHGSVL